MANTSLIEQEVLHEIAMSIGISLDLGDMLRECLPIFVRGLGCCTAAVLLQDGECGFFTPKCILPHAAMRNRGLHQAMAKAIDLHTSDQAFAIPLMEQAEQHLYYAWRLKETGILLLGRSNAFAYPLYMEVGPLVDKLAFAIQACEQYDSLRIAKQAMAKARDEAESANKAKSYFLATMSHEIRTLSMRYSISLNSWPKLSSVISNIVYSTASVREDRRCCNWSMMYWIFQK
jgi:signal transduction histidine kinase